MTDTNMTQNDTRTPEAVRISTSVGLGRLAARIRMQEERPSRKVDSRTALQAAKVVWPGLDSHAFVSGYWSELEEMSKEAE